MVIFDYPDKMTMVKFKFDRGQNSCFIKGMSPTRAPQKRRIATRDRLLQAADEIVADEGMEALRVEEVVLRAGVAKGTFFSHFGDKDGLLAVLIGARLEAATDRLRAAPRPTTPEEIAAALGPLMKEMARERIVFDVVLRYSGAAAVTEVGPIAQNFIDQIELLIGWIEPLRGRAIRDDIDTGLLAEGVQAFLIQAIALSFCAIEGCIDREERLRTYLDAWLSRH